MSGGVVGFPFGRHLYVLTKAAGAACNLGCKYCYYLEKASLLSDSPSNQMMDDELLELFIRQYIEAQTMPEVSFTWHGGEPLLRPIAFYEKALSLQHRYAQGRAVSNSIQTNGTLLTDEWCRFLKQNDFLVGISVDGTAAVHDAYRKYKDGVRGSHAEVLRGIEFLRKHEVEYNIMAVVNDRNVNDPVGFYRYLKSLGTAFIQFTPIVERVLSDGRLAHVQSEGYSAMSSHSVLPEQWGAFLCTIFDDWVRHDVGQVFVQLFDATLANWMGVDPGICTMAKYCGHAGALEHDGALYSCDHFVFEPYRLGNIRKQSILELMNDPRQLRFGRDKFDKLPRQCQECEYQFACWGECPKNRFTRDNYGEQGLNYLCAGYYRFFDYVAPYMDRMKALIQQQLPPAQIMREINH